MNVREGKAFQRQLSSIKNPFGVENSASEKFKKASQLRRPDQDNRILQRLSINALQLGQNKDQRRASIPAIPDTSRRRNYGAIISFVLLVIVPTIAAAVFYWFVASPQYAAEFKFSVKDAASPSNQGGGGLLAAIGGTSYGPSAENYLVVDYLTSRQVVEDLQARIPLVKMFSDDSIDGWSRFDSSRPTEAFLKYWQKMVTARYDQVTGIATVEIRAFRPQDALLIAKHMVDLSEELVNRISNRSRGDAVRFAESEVERAQERVRRVRGQLTNRVEAPTAGVPDTLFLDLERQIAQNMLASAMQSLEQARTSAAAQHLYITPFVRPNLPMSASYPRKYLSVTIAFILAFMIWLSLFLIGRSIFERFH